MHLTKHLLYISYGRKGIFVDLSSRREEEERLRKKKKGLKYERGTVGTLTVCSSSCTSRFMLCSRRKTNREICRLPCTRSQGTISSGGPGWCRGSEISGVGLRHASKIRPDRNIALICSHEIACLYVAAVDVKKKAKEKKKHKKINLTLLFCSPKKNAVLVWVFSTISRDMQTSRCQFLFRGFFWNCWENRTKLYSRVNYHVYIYVYFCIFSAKQKIVK